MKEVAPGRCVARLRIRVRYRGTSLIRSSADLGPCIRAMPRALWLSQGGGLFLMSEVPLCARLCPDREQVPEVGSDELRTGASPPNPFRTLAV